jgi:hypothetical protein
MNEMNWGAKQPPFFMCPGMAFGEYAPSDLIGGIGVGVFRGLGEGDRQPNSRVVVKQLKIVQAMR